MTNVVIARCLSMILIVAALSNHAANAQLEWQEQGDAIDLVPGQETLGAGPLHRIYGRLESPDDCDLFRIWIDDSGVFRASTVDFTTVDTQLFLFDSNGNGVTHNDDEVDGQSLQSTISGQFVPRPGIYYLGITSYNKDPMNRTVALIWNNMPFRSERQPDGPGAPGPLASWTGIGTDGDYGIQLQGAAFSNRVWDQPQLDVLMDTCPGTATIRWSNVPPNRQMGLVFGNRVGTTPISGGPCGGTTLGISGSVQLVRTLGSGPTGLGEIRGTVSAGACERYLQMVIVDGSPHQNIPCSTSNPVMIQDIDRFLLVCQYQVVCLTDDFTFFGGNNCTGDHKSNLCKMALASVGEFVRIPFGCLRVEDCPDGDIRGEKEFSIRNLSGGRDCAIAARYQLRRLACGARESHPYMPFRLAAPAGCTGICP